MMHRAYGHVDRASVADGRPLRVILASEGRQADGIDLRMSGVDLARYRGNPVLGYGHRYYGRDNLPIGRVIPESLAVHGTTLVGDLEFDTGDQFAVEIERKMRSGYLNAVSIGFDVTEWEDERSSYRTGGVATGWELGELSVVPVPMDANALVTAGRMGQAGALAVDEAIERDALLSLVRQAMVREGLWPPPHLGEAFRKPEPAPDDVPEPTPAGINADAARDFLSAFAPKESIR